MRSIDREEILERIWNCLPDADAEFVKMANLILGTKFVCSESGIFESEDE